MPTDTFSIASGNDDAQGTREGTSWASIASGAFTPADTGEFIFISHDGFTTYFYANMGCLRFNTAALPDDATITAAALKLYVDGTPANPDGRTLEVDYFDFGGAPIAAGDWLLTTVNGDAASAVAFGSFTPNAVNTINLSSLASISKTGYTGLRLALKDVGSPVANLNVLKVAAFEHASFQEPQLEVTYTTGGGGGGSGGMLLMGA